VTGAGEVLASLGARTDDPTRDLLPAVRDRVRGKLEAMPNAGRLLAVFDGEEERDEQALGRIFGEELPSGLVAGETLPGEEAS